MGITIHYTGTINDPADIPALADDIEDFARSMKWECMRLDEDWSQARGAVTVQTSGQGVSIEGTLGLKGVQINAAQCEPVEFFFDRHGRMRGLLEMALAGGNDTAPGEKSWVSVKTQFAGEDVHAWIVGLLKYVKKHYVADLEVTDEAEYWESGDAAVMHRRFAKMNAAMDTLVAALEGIRVPPEAKNWTPEQIGDKIEEALRARFRLRRDSDSQSPGS